MKNLSMVRQYPWLSGDLRGRETFTKRLIMLSLLWSEEYYVLPKLPPQKSFIAAQAACLCLNGLDLALI